MDAPEIRFWSKVDTSGECWEWVGNRTTLGYGVTSLAGRRPYAHRRSWELTNGPIPAGMVIRHACDNPPCVRPEHLILGTQAENLADMFAKGRGRGQMGRGAANPNARLSPATVRTIRAELRAGTRVAEIARRFGVRPQSIDAIATGKSWAWLDAT